MINKQISFVVPVHNEQENIENFINNLIVMANKLTNNFEIIVVDDGSQDESYEIALSISNSNDNIKIIKFSRNFGKEIALLAGLEHVCGDSVILIDADFQHPISLIPEFIKKWQSGYDMVFGIRKNREDEGIIKRTCSKLFYSIMHKFTKVKLPKNAGDYRLLDKKVYKSLISCQERDRFTKGLYSWVGFKSCGVEFEVNLRAGGKSSWNLNNLIELAITGITSFSNTPLRMWSFIGFGIAFLSFFYATYLLLKASFIGVDVPGYSSIMVSIFFFGGIQLCSIGVIGEYIAKIFNEVKLRPKYIIDEKKGFIDD